MRRYLLLLLLLAICKVSAAQSFVQEYKHHLIANATHKSDTVTRIIDASAERLTLTLAKFNADHDEDFLTKDTVYLVNFFQVELGWPSLLIWTSDHACYYRYEFGLKHWKIVRKRLTIEIEASARVKDLLPQFKQWVETADTSSYSQYAEKNPVLDGSYISFTRAVKTGGRWTFITSNSYTTWVDKH